MSSDKTGIAEENMIIVTDGGFEPDTLPQQFADGRYGEVTLNQLPIDKTATSSEIGLVVPVDSDIDALKGKLDGIDLIKVPFASFSDGRGFSIAVALRRIGFSGQLRAVGHVLADQYAHARRCGFDTVAISAALAARQPEAQWRAQVPLINETYQIRLHQARRAA